MRTSMLIQSAAAGFKYPKFMDILTDLSLTTDLKLCLDAGDAASYTSGQPWLDRSGGGYDFNRGEDSGSASDDPTFNGTAGGLSKGEYFELDGGDYFRYDSANEAWMNALHLNGAIYSVMTWMYLTGASANYQIFMTSLASLDHGMQWGLNSGGGGNAPQFNVVRGNSPSGKALQVELGSAIPGPGWVFVGVSIDEPTGSGGGFFYANGDYNQYSGADTFDATYASPSTADATTRPHIGSTGYTSPSFDPDGTRYAITAVWQGGTPLTKGNYDSVWSASRDRFGV